MRDGSGTETLVAEVQSASHSGGGGGGVCGAGGWCDVCEKAAAGLTSNEVLKAKAQLPKKSFLESEAKMYTDGGSEEAREGEVGRYEWEGEGRSKV